MSLFDAFETLQDAIPDGDSQFLHMNPEPVGPPIYPMSFLDPAYQAPSPFDGWEEEFKGFKTTPVLYNVDGFISPYEGANWGGTSNILQFMDDTYRLGNNENKIDPNRIFSSELTALRAIAADQQKIVKLFERRLMESLNEKGKMGLTEEDVEAMSALATARSVITNNTKEQVAVKKNIAEIRLKQQQQQQQQQNNLANGVVNDPNSINLGNGISIGRTMLDDIFHSSVNYDNNNDNVVVAGYQPTSPDMVSSLLDNITNTNDVSPNIQYEDIGAKVYVQVNSANPQDVSYAAYDRDGNILLDYQLPEAPINYVNIDENRASNSNMQDFEIKMI